MDATEAPLHSLETDPVVSKLVTTAVLHKNVYIFAAGISDVCKSKTYIFQIKIDVSNTMEIGLRRKNRFRNWLFVTIKGCILVLDWNGVNRTDLLVNDTFFVAIKAAYKEVLKTRQKKHSPRPMLSAAETMASVVREY